MSLFDAIKRNKYLYILGLKYLEIRDSIKVNRLKKFSEEKKRKYIARQYKKRNGMDLDWDHLNTYTEKMQWAKLYDSMEIKTCLADKWRVREWVAEKIGEEYLIPLLGVWDSFEEIDFSVLPEKFVLKVNNGSGTNVIVKNKKDLDLDIVKARIHYWMNVDRSYIKGFETHYAAIKPKIIAEQYLDYCGDDLPDYKFLCFDGEVCYCWVDVGRYHRHKRNIYDLNWNLQPWNQYNYGNCDEDIPKPENFDEMIRLAGELCKGFSHVRVDLYNVDGKIYFGEMTFTNGSGYEPIVPEQYNRMLGDLWKVDTDKR